eukprot:TRINITY_DN1150_c1_g1_i1.p1 TRINITY_DN1150_c1_g1~~TRINITY_DN1150_c1_g1_i1.p1  ORF type:complete len:539 (+),score=175.17 TRINITY_DN1150_c1_g1_i1:94-1617(+)
MEYATRIKSQAQHRKRVALHLSSKSFYTKQFKDVEYLQQFGPVTHVEFSPVSPFYLAATSSTKIQIHDSFTKNSYRILSRAKEINYSGSFKKDGNLIVSGDDLGVINVSEVASRSVLRTLKGHTGATHATKFSSDGIHIFSASDDTTARYWDLASQSLIKTFHGHTDYIRCGCIVKENESLWITGSYDHSVKIWDLREPNCIRDFQHEAPVESVVSFSSGLMIITADKNNIKVWDVRQNRQMSTVVSHQKTVTGLALGSSEAYLFSCSLDKTIKIHNTNDFSIAGTIKCQNPLLSVAISPDQMLMAAGDTIGQMATCRNNIFFKSLLASENQEKIEAKKEKRTRIASNFDIVVQETKRLKLKNYELCLKRFEHRNTLDVVIATNNNIVIFGTIEELERRGGLHKALAGRDEASVAPLFEFVRNAFDTDFFVIKELNSFALALLDIYGSIAVHSPVLRIYMIEIKRKIKMRIKFQKKVLKIKGIIEMIYESQIQKNLAFAIINETINI